MQLVTIQGNVWAEWEEYLSHHHDQSFLKSMTMHNRFCLSCHTSCVARSVRLDCPSDSICTRFQASMETGFPLDQLSVAVHYKDHCQNQE